MLEPSPIEPGEIALAILIIAFFLLMMTGYWAKFL